MRYRTNGINVRVNESEKRKLQSNAKKSGLSLSAYLRKAGLKQEIYAIPDKEFYKIYTQIADLKNEFDVMDNEQIKDKLEQIQNNFLDIYNSKKVGDDEDGYN